MVKVVVATICVAQADSRADSLHSSLPRRHPGGQRLCDRHDGIAAIKDVEILFTLLCTRFLLAIVMVLVESNRSPSFLS